MTIRARHPRGPVAAVHWLLPGVVLAVLSSCGPEDAAQVRARVAQWFALGDTMALEARRGCAAGLFRLVHGRIGSGLPVQRSLPALRQGLFRGARAALDDPAQPPDAAIAALVVQDWALGADLRRAALEGRACMDDRTRGAFGAALQQRRAVLAYDRKAGLLMLLDPVTGLLIVARGAA